MTELTAEEIHKYHSLKPTVTALITATQELMAKVCKREDSNKFAECTELNIAFKLIQRFVVLIGRIALSAVDVCVFVTTQRFHRCKGPRNENVDLSH